MQTNLFSYEKLCTKPRLQNEVHSNSEIAYKVPLCRKSWGVSMIKCSWHYKMGVHASWLHKLDGVYPRLKHAEF